MSKLINLIHLEEGLRHTPYYCSEGYPTIGYGFKIGKKGAQLPEFTLPKSVCDAWLKDLLDKIKFELSQFEWYVNLNDARKAILISMCYQIGFSGVMKFKNMIKAIE